MPEDRSINVIGEGLAVGVIAVVTVGVVELLIVVEALFSASISSSEAN